MKTSCSITIDAPLERIFELTSDLENWVPNLPHYRFINFFERSEDKRRNKVKMACWCRGFIPLSWHSIHEIKPAVHEVHFNHLRAFTKGMHVVWNYEPTADNRVLVTITHTQNFRLPWLAWFAEPVIDRGFIEPVANKTLATFKSILEAEDNE